MTDTQDLTSPEAVERLARHTEDASDDEYPYCQPIGATLRALSAERDDQKKARIEAVRSWVNAEARAEAAEVERDALKVELAEAVGCLRDLSDASQLEWPSDYPKGQDPLSIARAFLARHQKGPPQ